MFERNIIDLVGLFIENVQSLYPYFLGDLPWGGSAGPAALSWPTPLPCLWRLWETHPHS